MKTVRTYFLFFYVGNNIKCQIYGNCALELSSKFPNRIEVTQYIKENYNVIDLAITSIMELTKSEFDEWCRK